MAINDFQTEKWSAIVELAAQEQSIISQVASGLYEADATGAKVINSTSIGTPTIGTYVAADGISYGDLSDSNTPINLDQYKYFSFKVEDIDQAQSQADITNPAIAEAGRALALEADKYIFGLHGDFGGQIDDGGGTPAALSVTSADVEEVILNAKEEMDGSNAGPDRVLVVSPWFHNKMVLAGLTSLSDNVDLYRSGRVGQFGGFEVYMSNQLDSPAADEHHVLAFTRRAIPFAALVQKVETLRLESQFADAVRGLYVFGGAVKWEDEAVDIWVSKGSET